MTKRSALGSVERHQILVLLFCLLLVFLYTVDLREPARGVLSFGHHEWLTAHTLKFSRIWWHEGAYDLDFLMMETPPDIEHPTLAQRAVYPSYPPGAVIGPYLLAKFVNREPSVSLIMWFNLYVHLFVSVCLSLAVWLLTPASAGLWRLLSGSFAGCCYLLLPGPLFWQQNVYFTDTAVMAPWSLLLLVIAAESRLSHAWYYALTSLSFFWGFATDWFFVSIAMTWAAVQVGRTLISTHLGSPIRTRQVFAIFSGPVLAGLGVGIFYSWQLSKHGLWTQWRAKLSLRTFSTGDGATDLALNFGDVVIGYARAQYGQLGLSALIVGCAFVGFEAFRYTRRGGSPMLGDAMQSWSRLAFLVVAAFSPILHTLILRNHSYLHDFSVLKFAVPLACIPFALIPEIVVGMTPGLLARRRLIVGIFILTGVVYVLNIHRSYPLLVPERNPEIAQIGNFVHRFTRFDDVVFSNFVAAEPYPGEPHVLSHSLKLIHRVEKPEDLRHWLEQLPVRANIVWLEDGSRERVPLGWSELWDRGERVSEGTLSIIRLPRETLLGRLAGR